MGSGCAIAPETSFARGISLKLYFGIGLAAAALLCANAGAQTITSSLVGSVVDPSGAVVIGAPVTLTNDGTGAVRQGVTDTLGTYRFVNLDPGKYDVTVNAAGFKSETQTGIQVVIQETHNAGRMVVQIGSASESISLVSKTVLRRMK